MQKFIILLLIVVLVLPLIVFAGIGVGVGIGKIEVDKPLKPGGIYNISPLVIFNTGDEPADYEIGVNYHSKQPQLRPVQEWFSFSPVPFHLEPGQAQNVAVKITLPVKTIPGDYFAYLEAHPIAKAGLGTSIGVAAATKIYFTVMPANIWQAITYRISSFFAMYAPWSYVILAIVLSAIVITIFKKYFSFQFGIRRKK